MKTKIITWTILVVTITFFGACSTQPSAEGARMVAEQYVIGLKERNPEVFSKYCGGEFKEGMDATILLGKLHGFNVFDVYPENVELTYCDMVPGFQDIAIAVITNPENDGKLSYIMQLNNEGDWKLMVQEAGDITPLQGLMTSENLADHGIYTISDKDVQDAKEFLGW